MSCCPDGAWKNLNNKDYKPKGVIDRVDATGLDIYRVGNSEKCLIWNYTIFGLNGGRVKQMADFFADNGNSSLFLALIVGEFCNGCLNHCISFHFLKFRLYGDHS